MSTFSFFSAGAPWQSTVDFFNPLGITNIRGFGAVEAYACSDGSFLLLRLQSAAITDIVHSWSSDITQTGSWIESTVTTAGLSQGGPWLPLVTLTDYLATPGATSAEAAQLLMQGDDLFLAGTGPRSFIGGGGTNTVDFSGAAAPVQADLAAGMTGAVFQFSGIQNLRGSAFDDSLGGDTGANLLTGDAGNDVILGSGGNDTVIGGAGADQLSGGAGGDVFRYGSAAEGGDRILDYAGTVDQIEVSAAGFGFGLVAGMDLAATGHYVANKTGIAKGTAAQFIYNSTTHQLLWDDDGRGSHAAVVVADLTGGKGWSGAELTVIA